jgi:hypothetical protein
MVKNETSNPVEILLLRAVTVVLGADLLAANAGTSDQTWSKGSSCRGEYFGATTLRTRAQGGSGSTPGRVRVTTRTPCWCRSTVGRASTWRLARTANNELERARDDKAVLENAWAARRSTRALSGSKTPTLRLGCRVYTLRRCGSNGTKLNGCGISRTTASTSSMRRRSSMVQRSRSRMTASRIGSNASLLSACLRGYRYR